MPTSVSRRFALQKSTLGLALLTGCTQYLPPSQTKSATPLVINNEHEEKHTITVTVKQKDSNNAVRTKDYTVDAKTRRVITDFIQHEDVYRITCKMETGDAETVLLDVTSGVGNHTVYVDIYPEGHMNVFVTTED